MKKIILLITLLLFVKVHAQFFENEFGLSPETISIEEWSGSDWNESGSSVATFNPDCLVQTNTILIGGLELIRETYTYNLENQVIEIVTQNNNFISWVNTSRIQNTYTGDNLTEVIESVWDNSAWVNSIRTQNTYSGANLIEEIRSNWDGTNWVLLTRTLNTYNGTDQLQEILDQIRDVTNTSWEDNERSLFTYNTSGLLEEELIEVWNTENTTWDNLELTTYTYTGTNISETITYTWDGSAFLPEQKLLFTYNGDDLVAQVIVQEYNGSSWDDAARVTLTYPACQSLATEQFKTFDFSFHPNPANTGVKILNLPEGYSEMNYTIFDTSGRIVQKGTLNSDFTIATQHITNGLYLLKLSNSSGSATKQLAVKH